MKKFTYYLLLAITAIPCFQKLQAQPGKIDSSFGKDGIRKLDLGGSNDYACGLSILPNGKVLQGGTTLTTGSGIFCIAKYNSDGSLDNSFGVYGKSAISFGDNSASLAKAQLLQPDGKVIIGGNTQEGINTGFALARFNTDGSADESFGNKGSVVTVLTTLFVSQVNALALQPNGKILAAGYTVGDRAKVVIALVRYNANGSIDSSFGTNGKVLPSFSNDANAFAVCYTQAGKIVVGGYLLQGTGSNSNQSGLLLQFNGDGSRDNSFGNQGKTLINYEGSGTSINDLTQLPDGRLLAASEVVVINTLERDFGLTRLTANGSLDKSFGTDGLVKTNVNNNEGIVSIALQKDGKILAGGPYSSLVRYNPDGSLDKSFGNGGLVRYRPARLGAPIPNLTKIAIQNDNKLISGGFIYAAAADDFLLRRNDLTNSADEAASQNVPAISKIVLSPNPSVSFFNIRSAEKFTGKIIVTITTPEGIKMQQNILNSITERINVSRLKTGVYNVQVTAGGKQFVTTLVKE